jgi:integrase
MAEGSLTARTVATITKVGRHHDGRGLYLQVTKYKAKDGSERIARSWLFRYRFNNHVSCNGKPVSRDMGLGPAGDRDVTLAAARAEVDKCRALLRQGIDPIEARRLERAAAVLKRAELRTFKEAVESFLSANDTKWKNEKHAAQWRSTLETYAYPVLEKLAVAAIETHHVVSVLEPIWKNKTETASRVRGRIQAVLDRETVLRNRAGENPARWTGHLDKVMPARQEVRRVEHYPALPYDQLPAFMADLRARRGVSARALEFTILTAARTGAVIGATWDEIDLAERAWTVPPGRAGAKIKGQPRRVALSEAAIAVLRLLPRQDGNPHVFIGEVDGSGLSNMAMLQLMKDMNYPSTTSGRIAVPHGFRSTFKDWVSEETSFPNHLSEAALWHVVADKVEAAYRRGDMFARRRKLMEAWAGFACGQLGGNVVRLGHSVTTNTIVGERLRRSGER